MFYSISTDHPRNTRSATNGQSRFGEAFKYRAMQWNNSVPVSVNRESLGSKKMFQLIGVKEGVHHLGTLFIHLLPRTIHLALY